MSLDRTVESQTRRAGMISNRRCRDCGAALGGDDGEQCIDCRPRLSAAAQAAGAVRREREQALAALEREARQLQAAITKTERALNKWS